MRRKLKPVLDGDYWTIGESPDLGKLSGLDSLTGESIHECVDHHVFKSADGMWNLWGCIRSTTIGRVLYRWRSESLTNPRWIKTGEMLRADRNYKESVDDWFDNEYIQSPFIIVAQPQNAQKTASGKLFPRGGRGWRSRSYVDEARQRGES